MNQRHDNNSRYLAAACHSLRLRLQGLAGEKSVTPEAIQEADAAIAAAVKTQPLPPLKHLSHCFNLSPLEEGILLLCIAMELDTQIPHLCAQAQGNARYPYPTFALGFRLFETGHWNAISRHSPLRYWQLIQIHPSGGQPLTQSLLTADERIVDYTFGSRQLDERLAALVFPLIPRAETEMQLGAIAHSQQAIATQIFQHLSQINATLPLPVIQLVGTDTTSKQRLAQHVATNCGRTLVGLQGELLPDKNSEFSPFMRLWEREEYLLPLALYLDTQNIAAGSNSLAVLRRFLSHSSGIVFLDSSDSHLSLNREIITFEVSKPTSMEQRHAWMSVLGDQAGDNPTLLTSQFQLNLSDIEQIATNALTQQKNQHKEEQKQQKTDPKKKQSKGKSKESPSESRPDSLASALTQHLWVACLKHTRPRLEALAQRLETKATWEQLVLPDAQVNLLQQIADQIRQRSRVYDDWGFRARLNRGLGVSTLFAGESGTGKTMAAEVIANDLQLNLYRIDLSAVVNKYIGETEKNLRRLFDAAEDGGAILFFDEADALFGKRSEVKDSHDRYANIGINYLLQRIESYQGLAILATNFKSSLDTAFLRRLRFIIDFPFPSKEYRQQMWQKAFPPEMPLGQIDAVHLSQLNLTGGTIHNIVINAAFIAAQQGVPVGMEQILAAARTEYNKLERPIYEADFRWHGNRS